MVKVPNTPFVNRPEFIRHRRWPTPLIHVKPPEGYYGEEDRDSPAATDSESPESRGL